MPILVHLEQGLARDMPMASSLQKTMCACTCDTVLQVMFNAWQAV